MVTERDANVDRVVSRMECEFELNDPEQRP